MSIKTRVIFKKSDGKFYCQRLDYYKTWFGFGKEKTRWVYIDRWVEGDLYPPYSEGSYEPCSFGSMKDAKKYLKEYEKPEVKVFPYE